MDVRVLPAHASDEPILANLLELYVHDFSEVVPCEIGEDGRFGYPHLPAYWQEPGRFPFFIRAGTKLAGFALVRRGSVLSGDPDVTDMAEFFVLRGWRRCRVGQTAAHALFRHFPGWWEVRVLEVNVGGLRFWEQTVTADTGNRFERVVRVEGEARRHIFRFESRSR